MVSWLILLKNCEYITLGDCSTSCKFSFTNPVYPSFTLPAAQPNSPGDVTLNTGNSIIFTNGASIASGQGCNSGNLYALVSNAWTSTYIDATGSSSSFANAIYATGLNVMVRTIQSNQANLGNIAFLFAYHLVFSPLLASFLSGLPLKLELTCNNGVAGCIYFTVGGTSSNTLPCKLN